MPKSKPLSLLAGGTDVSDLSRTQAADFLLRSQITTGPLTGGLREGFDRRTGQYARVYCETTAYLMTHFVNTYRSTGDEQILASARAAAEFLLRHRLHGRIPYGYDLESEMPDPRSFSFDTAIAIGACVDLYEVTREPSYRDAAKELADWVLDAMMVSPAFFLAFLDTSSGERHHPGSDILSDGNCIHIKHAICLFKLGKALGDEQRYLRIARAILDTQQDLQGPHGGFFVARDRKRIFSHAHCYAAEGYLYGHLVTGNERYLSVAQQAGQYLAEHQAPDGGIYQYDDAGVRAADATAQAIRLWRTLDLLRARADYQTSIDSALPFLARLQERQPGDGQGSIAYTRGLFGRRSPIRYSWVSLFTLSALRILASPRPLPEEIY